MCSLIVSINSQKNKKDLTSVFFKHILFKSGGMERKSLKLDCYKCMSVFNS